MNPELLCATEIARTLRIPSAIKTDTFANGHVELLKVQIPQDSLIAGKTLMELPSLVKAKILICAVERGEQEVYIPSGSFRLEAGDRISFVALEAIKAAGSTDPAAVLAALPSVSYSGVSGLIEFDEIGDAKRDAAYIKSANTESGEWEFVKVQGIE